MAAITNAVVPPGQLAFWWLGQMGFVLKGGDRTVWVDAYLKPRPDRLVAPLFEPGEVTDADLICGTHDHSDHIDHYAWPLLATASPDATFVVPDLVRERVQNTLGIPATRFVGINSGETVDVKGVRITGVAAAHEFLDRDPATGRYPYMSYVFEFNGCTVYHSGDTCNYEGMETALRRWKFDVMFVPINGRDARRYANHCSGNMTYQEAADLCGAIEPGLIVPGHYDMFARNLGDVAGFVDYVHIKYPHVKVWAGGHGEQAGVKP